MISEIKGFDIRDIKDSVITHLINEEHIADMQIKFFVSVYFIPISGEVWPRSIVAVGMHFTVSLPLEGF